MLGSLFGLTAVLMSPGSSVPELFKADQFLLGHWLCEVRQNQAQPLKEVATYSLTLRRQVALAELSSRSRSQGFGGDDCIRRL